MKEKAPEKYIREVTDRHMNYLQNAIRYARFVGGECTSEWVSILGPDVLLLTHGRVTAEVAKNFLSYNDNYGLKTSDEEKDKILLAAHIHDWGEIIVEGEGVGDVTFEDKNPAVEENEGQIFDQVISQIDDEDIKKEFRDAYEIVRDRTTRMGKMFNTIERVGYLQTAIKAFAGKRDGQRIRNWTGIVGNILSNQVSELLKYSRVYPYVSFLLEQEKVNIQNMFEAIRSFHVPIDNEGRLSYDIDKLEREYNVWIGR